MLTPRQNLIATISENGKPDRFVKQWEAYAFMGGCPLPPQSPVCGGGRIVDSWGITKEWPVGTPGPFPIHDPAHIVCPDIENWREYVKAPSFSFPESQWEPYIEEAEKVDRNEQFVMTLIAPGIFEQCHYLCEITNTLAYLSLYPDEMKEMIKYLTEYELIMAEQYCKYIKPDAIDHHDDWGMQTTTFMHPDMFADYFLEPYKEIYSYYKNHGVEIIVHHSDSYGETLVPYMIEMGIDIWQGLLDTNNIPGLIRDYGGRISFHGGLNNGKYDVEHYSPEAIGSALRELYDDTDRGKYFIAGVCTGGPGAVYPGVYKTVDEEIEKLSAEYFK